MPKTGLDIISSQTPTAISDLSNAYIFFSVSA